MTIETETINGVERIWFPFLRYRVKATGELMKYPPPKEVAYTYVVDDPTAFHALCASGLLLDPRHTGRQIKPMIDNRKAPGA